MDHAAVPTYRELRPSRSLELEVRGLRYHLLSWGDEAAGADAARPPLVMLHGWMDVAASFQFIVDAMSGDRHVVAPDWRGYGRTQGPPTDSYWFPDYLGDLDALLDALFPGQAVDLVGHSMGANVAMIYAGVRSARVRRLVNLEGFGMPDVPATRAPQRYASWLDELKEPMRLRPYDSPEAVAARLAKNDPRLPADRAAWLATRWARLNDAGAWEILGDPAHKRVNPVPYRADEAVECWKRIEAPVLWVEGEHTRLTQWWGTRYPREEFERRIASVRSLERHVVAGAGHMLHHDQPEAVARLIEPFLDAA